MSNFLIVGYGKIGSRLGEILAANGHSVTGLKRHKQETLCSAANIVYADITRADSLIGPGSDYDQLLVILAPSERSEKGYRQIYRTGLNNLLNHLATGNNPPQALFVSSTSVYGQDQGEIVDESSPTMPTAYNGRILLEAEQRVMDYRDDSVIVRFSGIYGAGRGRLLSRLQEGYEVQFDPPVYTNRIHQDDCVRVLYFLLQERFAGTPLEHLYLASDHDSATRWALMSWFAEQTGAAAPHPVTAETGSGQNKRCSNRRLVSLGFQFKYPSYREGYSAQLQQQKSVND